MNLKTYAVAAVSAGIGTVTGVVVGALVGGVWLLANLGTGTTAQRDHTYRRSHKYGEFYFMRGLFLFFQSLLWTITVTLIFGGIEYEKQFTD